jgi:hypothetical protein
LLVKAIVDGFGGGTKAPSADNDTAEIPQEAMDAMQREAMRGIAAKAGSRLPIVRGRDRGLPKKEPVFDIGAMRERNAEVIRRRAKMKAVER